jgi:uncharacterized protein (DUF58 family)
MSAKPTDSATADPGVQANDAAGDGVRKYLDPKVLSHIHKLDIRSRLVVEGFLAGPHRSPYQGLSVEFAQHREYAPGDDTKFIDWRVFSRTDRFYLKQYQAETNQRCTFMVDMSESMKYAGAARQREGLTKFDYAACVTAALSMLLLQQQDSVGLVTFDENWQSTIAGSANPSQVKSICHALERASQGMKAKTSIDLVCKRACETLSHRGIVCIVSDLLVKDREAMMRSIVQLTHRGHDVMLVHILDEEELTFPFDGNTRFIAMEDTGYLTGEGRTLRDGYLEVLNDFIRYVQRESIRNRIDYVTVNTSDPLGAVLTRFLVRRQEFGRSPGSKRR